MRDHLSTLDAVAALDLQFAGNGVGRDEAVGMADQHLVAVPLQLIACISDDAVVCRLDPRMFRHGQIDAVIGRGPKPATVSAYLAGILVCGRSERSLMTLSFC
jgi:hypothetical protein